MCLALKMTKMAKVEISCFCNTETTPINGNVMAKLLVEAVVQLSSLVSPVLFTICMSVLILLAHERVSGNCGLPFMNDFRWVVRGCNVK